MTTSLAYAPTASAALLPTHAAPLSSKALYFLLEHGDYAAQRNAARDYLEQQLHAARALQQSLPAQEQIPAHVHELEAWMLARSAAVGRQYRDYLDDRKNGAPRRYFSSRSQALYFIKNVAPTKLVDGSWLFGLLDRWDDPDFRPLIQTYLEELGDGLPEKNHVVLYKKLLAGLECEQWRSIGDDRFVQGAIQLALAADPERYLPEIVGYNLGYEQLPLHLLMTSYELNELGIDPYYFTLHITVDNGGTGHAHKAVQGVQQLLARAADPAAFYRRMQDGYYLNDLGACTTSVIVDFDLEAELVQIMQQKSVVGQNMHSDYCRVAGRSINDWLAAPGQIPQMLVELEKAGWIKRGEAAENSRFWKLIQSERAEMFGVFSSYEQQILRDWIATPRSDSATSAAAPVGARVISFRARQRALDTLAAGSDPGTAPNMREHAHRPRGVIRHHPAHETELDAGDGASELRRLEQRVAAAGSKTAAMQMLIPYLAPARHYSASGLMATRIFRQLLA
ncbi:MAG: iron-containing redox enzyme family protein [Duganella sp.]